MRWWRCGCGVWVCLTAGGGPRVRPYGAIATGKAVALTAILCFTRIRRALTRVVCEVVEVWVWGCGGVGVPYGRKAAGCGLLPLPQGHKAARPSLTRKAQGSVVGSI